MFKKTRNNILMLNMVMVSAVTIISFLVIFFTTYNRVKVENQQKLVAETIQNIMVQDSTARRPPNRRHEAETSEGSYFSGFATRRLPPNAGLSFSVLLDGQRNILSVNSMLEMASEDYSIAAALALDMPNKNQTVRLHGRIWQFAKTPIGVIFKEEDEAHEQIFYTLVRFLDITDSIAMVRSLAFMLFGLTAAILAAFFFISLYFANKAIEPMEQAWEKQNRFVADASHELRTPISTINANCAVLQSEGPQSVESQSRWIESILRASERMGSLVASLLTLTSLEDGRFSPEIMPFDLGGSLERAIREIEAPAIENCLSIQCQIEPGVRVESDEEHVSQILGIMLDNAVKYTPSGGDISIAMGKEKSQAVVQIRNSGQGISKEAMPFLFERFFRADASRSSERKGYGLGLSIAKDIAQMLGIGIEAESEPGSYALFTLQIPVKHKKRFRR